MATTLFEPVTTLALSADERDELAQCERIFEASRQRAASALLRIHDGRLYRESHTSFEAYVKERWGIGRSRAYQLMDFATVSTTVDIRNERQARAELARQRRRLQGPPAPWPETPSVVFENELVRIVHGDGRDVVPTLDPTALLVVDPPFNLGVDYGVYTDDLSPEAYEELLRRTVRTPCVVVSYDEMLPTLSRVLGQPHPDKLVTWTYHAHLPVRSFRIVTWWGCRPDFSRGSEEYRNPKDKRVRARRAAGHRPPLRDWWHVEQVKYGSAEWVDGHPCQMPVDVMRRILQTTPAPLVCDPFVGSGTTLVAARALGLRAVGVEVSRAYCAIAARRVQAAIRAAALVSRTLRSRVPRTTTTEEFQPCPTTSTPR